MDTDALKAQLKRMMAERTALEAEIAQRSARLDSAGVGQHTPLVDEEVGGGVERERLAAVGCIPRETLGGTHCRAHNRRVHTGVASCVGRRIPLPRSLVPGPTCLADCPARPCRASPVLTWMCRPSAPTAMPSSVSAAGDGGAGRSADACHSVLPRGSSLAYSGDAETAVCQQWL